ncbi:MAG TPA: Mu transposase C-terminal domain-containing protein [Armatimonadota bacterium]|jgi:putative transposase
MSELSSLPETDRQVALKRFRLLKPHLEGGRALVSVAREASVPYRTAQRWVALYRRHGLAALTRSTRADSGARKSLSPLMTKVVEALALQKPPLPITAVYRETCRIASGLNEKPPSYSVVYDIVRGLPADLVMLAHEGAKAYGDAFELIHRREADGPNAIWQADHTVLDILLVRDDGSTAKPWLTAIIDDYSRAIAGYFLHFEAPSAIQTALALRQAIWRKAEPQWQICGIPDVLYTDNGSDFTSHHMEQVAADIKMQLTFSTPGKPRGRGRIERFFATLASMFLSGLPGHTPGSGGTCGKPTLTLSELDPMLRAFILDVYNQREHSETKMAPMQRWGQGGFLPRMPESLDSLDLLLLTVPKERKVHADGIHFQGLRYIDLTLAAYIGESVVVRYDPRDLAEIRVFHHERFLCRAICPELAGEVISLRDVLRARNQRRCDLRHILRDRRETIDALLKLKQGSRDDTPPEEQPHVSREEVETDPPALRRYYNE